MHLNPLARRPAERLGFPVMRGSFPVLGHLPALRTDALGLFRLAERELGPHFWIDSGFGQRMLHCIQPDVFSVFKTRSGSSGYLADQYGMLFTGTIFVLDGEAHQHIRSAMSSPFAPRGLTDAAVGDVIASIVERRVRTFVGREVPILQETREAALEVMFRIVGIRDPDLTTWRRRYEDLAFLLLRFPFDFPGSPTRRGVAARTWLDDRLGVLVRAARVDEADTGLLATLSRARDDDGRPLDERELVTNLRILLLAGHETSASTMAWLTTHLARRPDIWDRLCAEAEAAGELPRTPREARSFPLAEAVFREALRLYPPVITDARRVVSSFELAGRTIPEGVLAGIPILHLSRSPAQYDRPDEFDPDRWLGREQPPTPLELIQFGGGPHFCLGYHLAWLEIVQFTAALALHLGRRGLRPRLAGAPPEMRYLPLLHPPKETRVVFS